jgi:L-2-hydroxycarboxylate dehydrogenase (NAD+)
MTDGSDFQRVPAAAIRAFIAQALSAARLPAGDAEKCAELMCAADLTGADAHGVFRLPQYVRRLKAGGFNAQPNITVTKSAPAAALVDGDNGMGHLVMSRAAETAIALAREMGVAWVGVRRSNHAGPAGLYAEMPAAAGMIGLYTAVANANHMAVWGGADPLLGTNPLAIGVPSRDGPLVLDMARLQGRGRPAHRRAQSVAAPSGRRCDPDAGRAAPPVPRRAYARRRAARAAAAGAARQAGG